MLREKAYHTVQSQAMKAWEQDGNFRQAIEDDPEVQAYLQPDEISVSFSLERQLQNVDEIFRRVFNK